MDDESFRHDEGAANHVFEFSHVPGPTVGFETQEGFDGKLLLRESMPLGKPLREKTSEETDVISSFPQRRNAHECSGDAVVQVLAEMLLGHHGFEMAMRRGDEPEIDGARFGFAEPVNG